MDSFLKDIRYGTRSLLKRPTLTFIAIITLAIGIGANSAIFSAVNALLLKPLPFPELDRVVAIWDKVPSRGVVHNEVAMANYLDWKAHNHRSNNSRSTLVVESYGRRTSQNASSGS